MIPQLFDSLFFRFFGKIRRRPYESDLTLDERPLHSPAPEIAVRQPFKLNCLVLRVS
jgi:hypothetical protein